MENTICDQYLRPSLYLSKLDVVLYEITKPRIVPRLQVARISQCNVNTKELSDEHCEQGTWDTQVFRRVTDDGNGSRPGSEKKEYVPASKKCRGKNCMEKGSNESPFMSERVWKGRANGGFHGELNEVETMWNREKRKRMVYR